MQACREITNYTAAHESRARRPGQDRFDYPDQHIEAEGNLEKALETLQTGHNRTKSGWFKQFKHEFTFGIMRMRRCIL